jgi:hypothetical protein
MAWRGIFVGAGLIVLLRSQGGYAALPSGTRGWECVPGVIRNDGLDTFRLEVDCNGPVAGVTMNYVSPRLIPPGPGPVEFRDDGTGGDAVAGDFVFTAGPFRYDPASPMLPYYLNDSSSPAGLEAVSVGEVAITELDGTTAQFLLGPIVGVLREDVPAAAATQLAPDVVISRHLINVRNGTSETQRFLRSAGGDLRNLTNVIYHVLPDGMDLFMFFSTSKIELLPREASANFNAGLHATVQVNFTGTGQSPLDDATSYGSQGRLLSVNALDAYDRGISSRVAMHELLHEWGAFLDPALGLTDGAGHYSPRSDAASLLGGFAWRDRGDGALVLDCGEGTNGAYHASPIDKYMMGLIDAGRVGPLHAYDAASPLPLFRCGEVIGDIARTVTIDDIQQAHGPRTPGPAAARRNFIVTFVAESKDRFLNPTEMTYYEILAEHYGKVVPSGQSDPYVGLNWVPVQRFFGEGTTWSTVVPRFFDADADGDVDLQDFARFQSCFNGPNQPAAASDCGVNDFDHDSDVDFNDFLEFQTCFNGPNRLSACE